MIQLVGSMPFVEAVEHGPDWDSPRTSFLVCSRSVRSRAEHVDQFSPSSELNCPWTAPHILPDLTWSGRDWALIRTSVGCQHLGRTTLSGGPLSPELRTVDAGDPRLLGRPPSCVGAKGTSAYARTSAWGSARSLLYPEAKEAQDKACRPGVAWRTSSRARTPHFPSSPRWRAFFPDLLP